MIPKKEKFTTLDFSLIKKLKPRKIFTNIGVFCIYENPTKSTEHNKFAIVLSKKTFKKAVTRSLYKRIYFNFLKENKANIKVGGYMCIFYPNKFFTKDMLRAEMSKVVL